MEAIGSKISEYRRTSLTYSYVSSQMKRQKLKGTLIRLERTGIFRDVEKIKGMSLAIKEGQYHTQLSTCGRYPRVGALWMSKLLFFLLKTIICIDDIIYNWKQLFNECLTLSK